MHAAAMAFITSPYFLALPAAVLIILALPFRFPKFSLQVVDSELNKSEYSSVVYEDVDGNGFSDRVCAFNLPVGHCGIVIRQEPGEFTQEWDFPGQFCFESMDFISMGDHDRNGKLEAYVFTVHKDSLLLHIVPGAGDLRAGFRTVFVSQTGLLNGNPHLAIKTATMHDLDGDGYGELVFSVTAGYTVFPRKVFIYDIARNSLIGTPEIGANVVNISVTALKSGKKLIYLDTYASTNVQNSSQALHDRSSWLMVFDTGLRFLFPPVEFPGAHGGARNFIIHGAAGDYFGTLHGSPGIAEPKFFLYLTDIKGQTTLKKKIGEEPTVLLDSIPLDKKGAYGFATITEQGDYTVFDTAMNVLVSKSLKIPFGSFMRMDTDGDGMKELLSFNFSKNQLTILRDDLEHPAATSIELSTAREMRMSLLKKPGQKPLIPVFTGNRLYLLAYQHHLLYYWKWPIWLGVYLLVMLFTMAVLKIQRMQISRRFATEKKITDLQLRIVRNQMDPHFTMNALNAVVDAINREEKEQARESLLHFSKMYRSLVLSADQIKRTLKEELDFTENYLALERFRFGNRFSYEIVIDPEVDTGWEVPKMVIQSPVENAVKHGLAKRDAGCQMLDAGCEMHDNGRSWGTEDMITIHARKEDRSLVLEITDNGIGRQAAADFGSGGTGKGMEIMGQFFDLYQKVTDIRVQSEVTDLQDEQGNPSGTKVVVFIPLG